MGIDPCKGRYSDCIKGGTLVKNQIVIILCLLLLLLAGCTQPRVLTDLPDGEIVEGGERVALC